jgi:hypothetical protein
MFDAALIAARARRETLDDVRAELSRELRGAPNNAPPQTQFTYVGGLARARRMIERRYRQALDAEETIVMAEPDVALFTAAIKAGWEAIPDGNMDDMTPEALAAALTAAARVYAQATDT